MRIIVGGSRLAILLTLLSLGVVPRAHAQDATPPEGEGEADAGEGEADGEASEGEGAEGESAQEEAASDERRDAPAEVGIEAPPEEAVEEDEPPAPPVTLEWGRGLTARSDDGAFTLQIRARLQVQGSVETEPPGEGDPTIDFTVRRARIVFLGNFAHPNLQYYVQLGLAPRDMEPDLLIPLRDAVITWTPVRDFALRVGQMKVPFNRERVISSSALQLVDRSIVNAELTLDRDIGVQFFSTDLFGLGDVLAYQLGVFTGDGRLRVNEGTGLSYVARLQVQPFGEFDDGYSEVDFTREERARLSIGAGFAWNQASRRTRSTHGGFYELGGFDYAHFEADLMFKYAGFSLMSEVLYREATGVSERTGEIDGVTVTERARNGVGWMVQAGYLFSSEVPIELAARFADIYAVGAVTALTPSREITIGLSWYPMRHDLKVQLDYSHLSVNGFEEGQHRVRLQTQAYF